MLSPATRAFRLSATLILSAGLTASGCGDDAGSSGSSGTGGGAFSSGTNAGGGDSTGTGSGAPTTCTLDCRRICGATSNNFNQVCGNAACAAWNCQQACAASGASWCCEGLHEVLPTESPATCDPAVYAGAEPCPSNTDSACGVRSDLCGASEDGAGEYCCTGICGYNGGEWSKDPNCCADHCGGDGPTNGTGLVCDGQCIDPLTDYSNCGACGNACFGGATCVGGSCVCGNGINGQPANLCEQGCSDPTIDPSNCGGCGQACPGGAQCLGAECFCTAEQPELVDDGGTECCTSGLDVDPANCGACGVTCPVGAFCEDAACACSGASAIECDGACVNAAGDPLNCGGCGNVCDAPADLCIDGECSCPGDLTLCDGACVDTTSDLEHCGGCGRACDGDCALGQCVSVLATVPAEHNDIHDLVSAGGRLYWLDNSLELSHMSASGGAITRVPIGEDDRAYGLVVMDGFVYWGTSYHESTKIHRMPLGGTSATVLVDLPVHTHDGRVAIAAGDDELFVGSIDTIAAEPHRSRIRRIAVPSGAVSIYAELREAAASSEVGPAFLPTQGSGLAYSPDGIWLSALWASAMPVLYVVRGPGQTPQMRAIEDPQLGPHVAHAPIVSGSMVYFGTYDPPALWRRPTGSGSETLLVDGQNRFALPTDPRFGFVTDGAHLYWTAYGAGVDVDGDVGVAWRANLDGSGAVKIGGSDDAFECIAVDDDAVYWATTTRITRLSPK